MEPSLTGGGANNRNVNIRHTQKYKTTITTSVENDLFFLFSDDTYIHLYGKFALRG